MNVIVGVSVNATRVTGISIDSLAVVMLGFGHPHWYSTTA
jgi:hypothetical protein